MIQRRDALLGLVVFAVLLGFIFVAMVALMSAGSDGLYMVGDCVAIVEVNGAIMAPMPVVNSLERIIDEENVRAVVVRLNTPGGGISATQEIYETVLKVRRQGVPVIASMGAVAASGGYYIAAACDTIVATPGTITGSIGVIANFAEFSELFDKLGITFNTRKTGAVKDAGSIAREMNDEDAAMIDSVIMDSYDQFVEAVSEGRELDYEYVREYADGRVFTGRQARELGFVDELGTYQDAIDLAGEMVGLGIDPPVLRDSRGAFWESLVESTTSVVVRSFQRAIPRIAYMWSL